MGEIAGWTNMKHFVKFWRNELKNGAKIASLKCLTVCQKSPNLI